jgi:hypothetical protein
MVFMAFIVKMKIPKLISGLGDVLALAFYESLLVRICLVLVGVANARKQIHLDSAYELVKFVVVSPKGNSHSLKTAGT